MLGHDAREVSRWRRLLGKPHLPAIEWSDTVWEPRDELLPVAEVTEPSPLDLLMFKDSFQPSQPQELSDGPQNNA